MKSLRLRTELQTSLLYALFGGLWILFSDRLLAALVSDSATMTEMQTYKGWFFVAASALLIFSLLRRDLILHHKTEQELRKSEQRYRGLFEHAMEAITQTTPDGKYLAANPAAAHMLGYDTPEEAIAHVTDLDRQFYVLPGRRQEFKNLIEEAGVVTGFESEIYRRDGSTMWISENSQAIRDEQGTLLHYEGTAEDITLRKKAEDALRQTEEKYRTLVEQTPVVIYEAKPGGGTLYVNPQIEKFTGFSLAEWLEQPDLWSRQLFPPDKAYVFEENARSLSDNKGYILEYRLFRKDGKIIWVHDEGRPVRASPEAEPILRGFWQDITERKQAEEKIHRQVAYLSSLREIEYIITSTFDLHMSLNALLARAVNLLGVDAADMLLVEPYMNTLKYTAGLGFRTNAVEKLPQRLGESYAGRAVIEQRRIEILNLKEEPNGWLPASVLDSENFVSYTCLPLVVKGKSIGVFEVYHRSAFEHDQEWLDFFTSLAGQAAIAIDNASLFDNLQRSNTELTLAYDATIEGWSRAMDLRDEETEGHTRRVVDMTIQIAKSTGVPENETVHLRYGALLHDIGKLGIPDHILHKKGHLTEAEWAIMKQHPRLAYEMLQPIAYLHRSIDIPYCHHEKWDGSGYPRGLKGEQIPLAARIFAIVDVWDALISNRPYRDAWPAEKAREYIRTEAGRHFDPRVAEKFLELITHG